MNIHANKGNGDQSRAAANDSESQKGRNSAFQFADNRPEIIAQRKLNLHLSNAHASVQNASASLNTVQPLQRQILNESGFARNLKIADKQESFDFSLGYTPPTVNFEHITKAVDVVNAFKGKDELLTVTQNGDKDFTAQVNIVPQNHVGYMMYLPQAGPWIKEDAKKKDVLAILNVQDNGRNLTNVIKLEITGPGGHEKLAKQVEDHEYVHAKDNELIRDKILKPWDVELMSMQKKNRLFKGESADDATKKLWAAAGGSLQEIAVKVNDAWGNASDDFHNHKHGKTEVVSTKINDAQTDAVLSYRLTI